jgi:1,4-dihydroxy-2-naphthoyl-CoA hydrolase
VCGDPLSIALHPKRLDPSCFEVRYVFQSHAQEVATGLTRHLAIRTDGRQRCELPRGINRWLEASTLQAGIQPLS